MKKQEPKPPTLHETYHERLDKLKIMEEAIGVDGRKPVVVEKEPSAKFKKKWKN